MKKVFTTGQVAKIVKVAPRTVSKWFDSGKLKGYKIPGSNDRRIPREALIRFLQDNEMPLGELALPEETDFWDDDKSEMWEEPQPALPSPARGPAAAEAPLPEAAPDEPWEP